MNNLAKLRDKILHCVIVGLCIPPSQYRLYLPTHIIDNIALTLTGDRLVLEFFGEGAVVVAIPDYKQDRWYPSVTFLGENRKNSIYPNDFDAFWQQLVVPYLEKDQ